MIVADASAIVDLLLARGGAAASRKALGDERRIHAPHLLETEVVSALRRWTARGSLIPARAAQALADLNELPIVHHPHAPLTPRVWALRERLSAYDATYLALAEALDATLLTADRGLARSASDLVPVVDVS